VSTEDGVPGSYRGAISCCTTATPLIHILDVGDVRDGIESSKGMLDKFRRRRGERFASADKS
jgi:hypothetical protein